MNHFQVAFLQILPGSTRQDSLEKGISACREAKKAGADLALFPEMWSTGYSIPQDISTLKAEALSADDPYVITFSRLAAQLDMAIGITLLERHQPTPRNTLILFDRHGKKALTYAKVHTCDFGEERCLTPGDDFPVTPLDTAQGIVHIGAMICYDREFPESARILMLKGAEIILVPNACPMEINRLCQLRSRAYENMVGIATCNYPCGQPDCNGHSSAFDGVAYLPDLPDSRDTCILEAGGEEGIYLARFDLDMLREYRKTEIHGNAYRHPQKYHLLISERIEEPFIRGDYRK
nr:carbon-nitrogen hydrolase family protein [bacterium]